MRGARVLALRPPRLPSLSRSVPGAPPASGDIPRLAPGPQPVTGAHSRPEASPRGRLGPRTPGRRAGQCELSAPAEASWDARGLSFLFSALSRASASEVKSVQPRSRTSAGAAGVTRAGEGRASAARRSPPRPGARAPRVPTLAAVASWQVTGSWAPGPWAPSRRSASVARLREPPGSLPDVCFSPLACVEHPENFCSAVKIVSWVYT